MKTIYPIAIIDLRQQPDHKKPEKILLFQEYSANRNNARLFLLLRRRKETEFVSDGNKLLDV